MKLGPLSMNKASTIIHEIRSNASLAAQLLSYECVEEILGFHLIYRGTLAILRFFSYKDLKIVFFENSERMLRISHFQTPLRTS